MQYTKNYKFKKPEGKDIVNIEDLNNNVDDIDSILKVNEEKINQFNSQMADSAKLGTTNQIVNKTKAVELKTDTRTTELIYTDGNLTQVLEKDGTTTVKTTTLNLDIDGNLISVTETAGGTTVTTTLNYTDKDLSSVTKEVL